MTTNGIIDSWVRVKNVKPASEVCRSPTVYGISDGKHVISRASRGGRFKLSYGHPQISHGYTQIGVAQ